MSGFKGHSIRDTPSQDTVRVGLFRQVHAEIFYFSQFDNLARR